MKRKTLTAIATTAILLWSITATAHAMLELRNEISQPELYSYYEPTEENYLRYVQQQLYIEGKFNPDYTPQQQWIQQQQHKKEQATTRYHEVLKPLQRKATYYGVLASTCSLILLILFTPSKDWKRLKRITKKKEVDEQWEKP